MKPRKSCVTIRLSCKIVLFSSVVWLTLYFFGKEGIKILILNHKYQVSWFYCEIECLLTFSSLNQRFPLILRLWHGLLLEDCISVEKLLRILILRILTVCYYHATYADVTYCHVCVRVNLHSIDATNVKELLGWNRNDVWSLNYSNWIWTHYHLARKRTLNHLVKLARCCHLNVSILIGVT